MSDLKKKGTKKMAEDLGLTTIDTASLDTDLNDNFSILEDAIDTVSLDLNAFETATQSALDTITLTLSAFNAVCTKLEG